MIPSPPSELIFPPAIAVSDFTVVDEMGVVVISTLFVKPTIGLSNLVQDTHAIKNPKNNKIRFIIL